MSNQHDKISTRLALILTKLNEGKRLTIDELADEFNVTKRTIQRDLNERFSYVPIQKENGYYFLEAYCLGKLNFDDIKNFAALSGIKKLYPTLSENFIVDLLNSKINKNYLIKGCEYEDLSNKTELFDLINIAITKSLQLQFHYNDKQRVVSPYKLANIDGIWYLVAEEDNILKNYSFTKIANLSQGTDTFIPNKEFLDTIKKNQAKWFSQTSLEVTLQISTNVSEFFIRRNLLPSQTILERNTKYITLSTKVSYDEEILKVVRYWIPHIKILEPAYLQQKLDKELTNYLKTTQPYI